MFKYLSSDHLRLLKWRLKSRLSCFPGWQLLNSMPIQNKWVLESSFYQRASSTIVPIPANLLKLQLLFACPGETSHLLKVKSVGQIYIKCIIQPNKSLLLNWVIQTWMTFYLHNNIIRTFFEVKKSMVTRTLRVIGKKHRQN